MGINRDEVCEVRVIHQPRIEKAKKMALDVGLINQLSQLFKAISDPGRIKILKALEHDEMCVCDLAVFLGVSESAVSHQLRMLRQLNLVVNRREGAVLYYRLSENIANRLIDIGLSHIEE